MTVSPVADPLGPPGRCFQSLDTWCAVGGQVRPRRRAPSFGLVEQQPGVNEEGAGGVPRAAR